MNPEKNTAGKADGGELTEVDDREESKETEDFETALTNYSSRKCFLVFIILMCSSPLILNGFHAFAGNLIGDIPRHWCTIHDFDGSDWSPEQIRDVSSPNPTKNSNCKYYKRNYELLISMGYQTALEKVNVEDKPYLSDCSEVSFDGTTASSMVVTWNLVCGRLIMKPMINTMSNLGKCVASFTFGTMSDRFGRKVSFTVAAIVYIFAGPIVMITEFYTVMLLGRFLLGFAAVGIYESSFSILSEISPTKIRSTIGLIFNLGYPVGGILLAIIGRFNRGWKELQLFISLPAILLVFHVFLIPESPRWLYYSGRKKRAWKSVAKYVPEDTSQRYIDRNVADIIINDPSSTLSCSERCKANLRNLATLFHNFEYMQRLAICCLVYFSTSISYYGLAFNADNLSADKYVYTFLICLVEIFAYVIPLPFLPTLGRQCVSSFLLMAAAVPLLVLLAVPKRFIWLKFCLAIFGRFCAAADFAVVIIHSFELFPTVSRNCSMGVCSTFGQLAGIIAPIIVDMLGAIKWYIPSTIFGILLFSSGIMVKMLPETKNLSLYNNMEDLSTRSNSDPNERVTIRNCPTCTLLRVCKECCCKN